MMKKFIYSIYLTAFFCLISTSGQAQLTGGCSSSVVDAQIFTPLFGTDCRYKFIGENDADEGNPNNTFSWEVTNLSTNTVYTEGPNSSGVFIYTFPSDATYEIKLTVSVPYLGSVCTDTETVNWEVNGCDPVIIIDPNDDPTCPPVSCFDIVPGTDPCEDVQAWMNCPDPDIVSIDWSYSIGTHIDVPFHTSAGNPAGQHAAPLSLPNPPSSGSWDNYVLYVFATVHFADFSCDEVYVTETLVCPGGGSGNQKIGLAPNPTRGQFQIENEGKSNIQRVLVTDLAGNIVLEENNRPNDVFDLSSQKPGVYVVQIYMADGSTQVKRVVLSK